MDVGYSGRHRYCLVPDESPLDKKPPIQLEKGDAKKAAGFPAALRITD
jgi:hypothetical protein